MIATDQQSLINASTQLQRIPGITCLQIQVALLAQIAGPPYSTYTAQQLIALAAPIQQINSPILAKQIMVALLGIIAQEV